MHLVGTHGDAVQGAVILIRAVVGALLYGTLDAMVGTTGFHIESLLLLTDSTTGSWRHADAMRS